LNGFDANILSDLNINRNFILRMKRESKFLYDKVILNSDGQDFCNYIKYKFPIFQLDDFLDKNVIILSPTHRNDKLTDKTVKITVKTDKINTIQIKESCLEILRVCWCIFKLIGQISLVILLIILLILLILMSFSDIFEYINFVAYDIENYTASADVYDCCYGIEKDDLNNLDDDGYSDP